MKKVCFTIANYSNFGGTERVCEVIASQLSNMGYEIHLLSLWGDKSFFEYNPIVRLHRLIGNIERTFAEKHPKYLVQRMRLFFKFNRMDLVVDVGLGMCNTTLPAIENLGIKHIAWNHFSYTYFKEMDFMKAAYNKVLSKSDAHVVLTSTDRGLFVNEQNENPYHIHVISNPLTFNLPEPIEHNSKVVLSVGRFSHEKGMDLLLKAWKKVESLIPDWELQIWGDNGIDKANVRQIYDKLKLSRASLHPATPNIKDVMAKASLYVLPSRHEGFGLVLLEAAAMSLPLIAFDCPNGPREIIENGYNGILVKAEDIDGLADAIVAIIQDNEKRQRIGKNAYNSTSAYLPNQISNTWCKLIEDVLKP